MTKKIAATAMQGGYSSDLRDATARIETVDELRALLLEAVDDEGSVDQLRSALVDEREDAFASVNIEELLADVAERTGAGIAALDDVSLEADGFAAVKGGLRKTYRRGCKLLEKSKSKPSAEMFHTWRKRVKYHRYHVDLLENLWKPALQGWEQALHDLTDDLGRANDLAVLDDFIGNNPDAVDAGGALVAVLHEANAEARRRALARGERAFAESPDALVARFADYWVAWRPTG